MNRRKYLAAVGAATSLGLAGCSSGTGGNNSSGGNGSGGNGSGGESTEAASGGEETEMESGGDSTDAGGDTTESSGEEATEGEDGDETATESDESSGEESTETDASSGDSGGSSSISDSGDTDVSLQSADVGDAYSLDSVEYYSEDMSNGVRGEVTNTTDSSISYTGIQVKLYDSDDTRIGETLDNTSDLGAGETYAFDAIGMLTGDKADSVASYTIAVSDSAF